MRVQVPLILSMPRKSRKKRPRLLIVGRMDSMVYYGRDRAVEFGFDADTALTNEDALELLETKGPFVCAIFGCYFQNAERYRDELEKMRLICRERNVPMVDMPFYGNIRDPLYELKLLRRELVDPDMGRSDYKLVDNWEEIQEQLLLQTAGIAG